MGRKKVAKQESLSLTDIGEPVSLTESPSLAPPPPKSRIGDLLKRYREEKKISLKQISQQLCIRQSFLKAIEEGLTQKLPERVYTLGFIRSYSRFLGLDEEAVLKEYRKEVSEESDVSPYIFPAPVPKKSLPSFLNYGLGILCIGLAFLIWMYFKESFFPAAVLPHLPSEEKASPLSSFLSRENIFQKDSSQETDDLKKPLEVPDEDS